MLLPMSCRSPALAAAIIKEAMADAGEGAAVFPCGKASAAAGRGGAHDPAGERQPAVWNRIVVGA